MDALEFVQRRYRQLIPQPVWAWQDFPLRPFQVWLTDDVCPLVEGSCKRPLFKDQATWPLRVLVAGVQTAERRLIEAIDAGLVQAARALLETVRPKRVQRALAVLHPPQERTTEEECAVTATGKTCTAIKRADVDTLPIELQQVELIAQRFWTDLVCKEDYFEPRGGWMSHTRPNGQPGDFVVALTPELHPIGDFVTRTLLRRIEGLLELLAAFRGKCLQAVQQTGSRRSARCEEERNGWQALTANVAALQQVCLTGQTGLVREACIILTQTYAAFGRSPNLGWLGLPGPLIKHGAFSLRHRVTHTRHPEMIERIAATLGQLRHVQADGLAEQAVREEAIASGGLVLLEGARAVYWESQPVEVPWRRFPVLWKLLWQLAAKAILGAAVKEHHVYSESGARSKLPTVVNRLTNLLPPSLMRLIHSVHGERSYRLHLESNRIHFLE